MAEDAARVLSDMDLRDRGERADKKRTRSKVSLGSNMVPSLSSLLDGESWGSDLLVEAIPVTSIDVSSNADVSIDSILFLEAIDFLVRDAECENDSDAIKTFVATCLRRSPSRFEENSLNTGSCRCPSRRETGYKVDFGLFMTLFSRTSRGAIG